jgi:serine phosphatase RsbU (regulator of sigma subunit)
MSDSYKRRPKMTVARRLYLLVAVGVLSAAIISGVAVLGVVSMSRGSHSLFGNAFLVSRNVARLNTLFNQGAILVQSISSKGEDAVIKHAAAEFDTIDQSMADTSIEIFQSITDDKVRDSVTKLIADLDKSRTLAFRVFAAAQSHETGGIGKLRAEHRAAVDDIRQALGQLDESVDRIANQELARLEATQRTEVPLIIAIAIAGLFAFAIAATVVARQIGQPISALTRAAREVERRTFEPQSLKGTATQRNEFGTLARVFSKMAVEMLARQDELESLVHARTRDLEAKNAELEKSQERMQTELEIARLLQTAMLPRLPSHPNYTGRAMMVPAQWIGGDFYDFFAIGDNKIGLVIADVSGKGVPAALFMAISRTVLQASARDQKSASAGDCLAQANALLCEQNPLDLFVTVFYGILDVETGELSYANGGHIPPVIIRQGGQVALVPRTGGMAMGVLADLSYAEGNIVLQPNDTLFLYTDGISEAMDPEGHEFSEERLLESLSKSHHQSLELVFSNVTEAVHAFAAGAPQSDDITCLALRYRGPPVHTPDLLLEAVS